MGHFAEAVSLCEAYFDGFVEYMDDQIRQQLTSIESLWWCYNELGRYNDALSLYQPYFNQIRSMEGGEHPTLMEI